LTFIVEDTGIGIQKENMDKLFNDFVQLDSHKNKGIEGTGLGLSISRNLCRLMGGDITVESEYGKGSIFTVTLMQEARDYTPIAKVENPEEKGVLLYERRAVYRDSLVFSFKNLGVPLTVTTREKLFEEIDRADLSGKPYPFVFVSPDVSEKLLAYLKEKKHASIMVLLANLDDIEIYQQTTMAAIPAYTVPIANVLNGVSEIQFREQTRICFTAPQMKVLIVDDIVTNLNVARGLLELYKMNITTASSGEEAIDLVKENAYDIIFMDHMMPDMDGIETTAEIRALEEKRRKETAGLSQVSPQGITIIALTANAISGMKEMFLGKGFNDYLSKPIETSRLDALITKWTPDEKKILADRKLKRDVFEGDRGTAIPGIDVKTGIHMTGGTLAGYNKVLASFRKDVLDRLPLLEAFLYVPGKKRQYPERDIDAFVTHVHALKSAAGTIGAAELSKEAAELEIAGKAGDIHTVEKKLSGFYQHLSEITERIDAALAENVPNAESGGGPGLSLSDAGVRGLFAELKTALEAKDMEAMDRVSGELTDKGLDKETAETLDAVSDLLLVSKFKAASAKIDDKLGE
jgi:CheY-like chemotaxis protein